MLLNFVGSFILLGLALDLIAVWFYISFFGLSMQQSFQMVALIQDSFIVSPHFQQGFIFSLNCLTDPVMRKNGLLCSLSPVCSRNHNKSQAALL